LSKKGRAKSEWGEKRKGKDAKREDSNEKENNH